MSDTADQYLEDPFYGKPISVYTRAQAIEDGVLIDISTVAAEAGIIWPVAVTAAVWADIENIPKSKSYQDVNGRLWDLLSTLRRRVGRSDVSTRIDWQFIMHVGRNVYYQAKAVAGPGDNGEPVITILKVDES